ncbi:wall-associated receptor kinase-like 14 [Cucurbita moschata]|uniref:Wall-associated receptor kinase-like 14 n=1 Tax=Cucurbita moschata TaxID=3662 RepID=A0A6J1GD56_CUCMO|nr:wall-associated receptor kinase-like 14 [Cucurbita moschata]
MTLHRNLLIVIIAIFSASLTIAGELTSCETGNSAEFVQHPFGFSNSSPIKLNCSKNGEVQIGRFQVQNITERSILIKLPEECNISINSMSELFGQNYKPTLRNSLLLNCTEQPISCGVMANFSQNQKKNCGFKSNNFTCFTKTERKGFLPSLNKCQSLLSSVFVNFTSQSTSSFELQFGVIELEWWLSPVPSMRCSKNANRKNITSFADLLGFRCQCIEGFEGNAYDDVGHGCRKVSHKCNLSTYITGHCGRSKVAALIGGVIVGAFIMAVLILICYCIRRRSLCLKGQMSAKRLLSEAAGNSSVTLYPYKEIERATSGFSEKQRLGTGAFGTVYAGRLHEDEWVAVKRIKYRDHNSIDQVMNEIKLLSSVSHPNLVRLLGCCIEEGQQILVYEFMPNGTLSQHLQRERGNGLPWTTRLTIAAETSRAIAYLHSSVHPPIYHRDIKSSNILLDHSFKSKVADFGLSRLGMTEISHVSTAPQGTPGYVDPQYHQNFYLSDKSDVYSFGVVLIEIITALKVVDFTRPPSEVNLAALAIDRIGRGCVDELIDPFLEPNRDAWTLYSVHKVVELAFRCLAFHSDMRPSMTEVAEELESIRRSGWTSMEENFCAASSTGSACSSPRSVSERSISSITIKKAGLLAGLGSQRLIIPPENNHQKDYLPSVEEVMDSSPVSIQDPWLSEQSSPSTNSLLGNVAR